MPEETTGELLKRLLAQKDMSQRKLAILSGVDRGYINAQIKGRGGSISLRIARQLASALNQPPEIFLRSKQSISYQETSEDILERLRISLPHTVPIYEDFPVYAGEPLEPMDYVHIARDWARGKRLEGYIVHGVCLEPDIKDGSIIIVDRDAQKGNGDVVAALVDGELYLARLRKIADEVYLENNEGRIKLEESQMAAPVIEVRRRLK